MDYLLRLGVAWCYVAILGFVDNAMAIQFRPL
jgi:hypothetical protein